MLRSFADKKFPGVSLHHFGRLETSSPLLYHYQSILRSTSLANATDDPVPVSILPTEICLVSKQKSPKQRTCFSGLLLNKLIGLLPSSVEARTRNRSYKIRFRQAVLIWLPRSNITATSSQTPGLPFPFLRKEKFQIEFNVYGASRMRCFAVVVVQVMALSEAP